MLPYQYNFNVYSCGKIFKGRGPRGGVIKSDVTFKGGSLKSDLR